MLENISTEELKAVLYRRQKAEQELLKPKQLKSPNIEPLQKICQEYIDELVKDGYVDDNFDHDIYECAMETIFGKDVWKFINSIGD